MFLKFIINSAMLTALGQYLKGGFVGTWLWSSGMHLTSKWHQEAGGFLGSWEVGQLFSCQELLTSPPWRVDRGLHAPEVLNWGTMGQVPTVRQGRGRNSDTNTSPHLVGADQSGCLHTLNGPAQGSN